MPKKRMQVPSYICPWKKRSLVYIRLSRPSCRVRQGNWQSFVKMDESRWSRSRQTFMPSSSSSSSSSSLLIYSAPVTKLKLEYRCITITVSLIKQYN